MPDKANYCGVGKEKAKHDFPSFWNPPVLPWVVMWAISVRRLHTKKYIFRTWHFTTTSPRLTGHGSPPNVGERISTNFRVLVAKVEGRRWSVSRDLAWDVEPWPIYFSDRKWPPVLYRKNLIENWVMPPHPKRDLETQTTNSPRTGQVGFYV